MPTPPTGTIDITDLVEKMRSAWVTWAEGLISGAILAIPGIGGFLTFMYNVFGKALVKLALDFISKQAEMLVFFTNTAIRKASQAKDFIDAVAEREALPPNTPVEIYLAAERKQSVQFRNFVMVTN